MDIMDEENIHGSDIMGKKNRKLMILICLASKSEWVVVLFAEMWNTGVILRGLYVGELGRVCMCVCVNVCAHLCLCILSAEYVTQVMN